jgi:hypothetical protein
MKRTHLLAVFVALFALLFAWQISAQEPSGGISPYEPDARPPQDEGERLAVAVVRLNKKLQDEYAILSPTPITVTAVKDAIEAAADELAKGDSHDRLATVTLLTEIQSSERLPPEVRLYLLKIHGVWGAEDKAKYEDGRHVDVTLNYVLEVPSGSGRRRALGLTTLSEGFRITKPAEQKKPLEPPAAISRESDGE